MKANIFRRTQSYVRQYWLALLACAISAVISVGAFLLLPVIIGRVIDQIIGAGQVDFDAVAMLLRWFMFLLVTASVLQWIMLIQARRISAQVAQAIRRDAFARIHKAPLGTLDKHPHGDVVSRLVTDAETVSDGLLQAITGLLPGIVTVLVTIVLMLLLDVGIALLVIVVTPLSVLPARFLVRRTRRHFGAQNEVQGEMSAFVSEVVQNRAVVAATSYEGTAQEIFEEQNTRFFTANVRATFFSSLANPTARFVNGLIYAAVAVLGALSVVSGGLTVGSLSAFLAYAHQYTRPFNEGAAHLTQLQAARAALSRLYTVIDWEEEAADAPEAICLKNCAGEVSLRHVSFAYDEDTPVLQDVSLEVPQGAHIVIVGPTGSGKTTLMNLLMRFYDADAGEITIDGTAIAQIERGALRRLYGMVLQDSFIRRGTVRENIAYGKPEATMTEIEEAARAAHIHSFIMGLKQGYDTTITGDSSLSAGQKQLIGIARIFLAKPAMLLLDEATSAIDTRTERLVQDSLRRLMRGRTSFIVAHRLGTIQEASAILVMEHGRVIEQGTHAQLLTQNGLYTKLYESQFGKMETGT